MRSTSRYSLREARAERLPWRRRISVRTALLSWLVAVLTTGLFAGFTYPAARRTLLSNLRAKASVVAAEASPSALRSLTAANPGPFEKYARGAMAEDASVLFVALADSNGVYLAEQGSSTNLPLTDEWRNAVKKAGIRTIPDRDNLQVYQLTQPLDAAPGTAWISVGLSLRAYHDGMDELYGSARWVALACILVALITSIYYARKLVRPIKDLRLMVQKVGTGDFSARAPVLSHDEMGELAGSLNGMAETLQRTHSELSIAKDAAEAASEAKSRFLATVSHEIRTPINGVIGMLKLIKDSPLDTRQAAQVNTAITSARALLSVIEGILDFSKIEAGKIELESIDFDLPEVVDSAVMIFQERAAEKGIQLDKEIAPDVPLRLKGDPNRLSQILINLIANAIKFTSRGHVTAGVGCFPATDGSLRLAFTVADTGVGIPLDQQNRLFKPFSQADSSTTRKYGGTGLGLAICKQLVELMGGTIDFESTVGVGTRFRFVLPFQPGAAASPEPAPVAAPAATDGSALRKASILVVEDNNINAYVTRELLVRSGYACDVVTNGEEAVRAFSVKDYDLILMDIQMPILDGYEATKAIRDKERHRPEQRVPIVALTANALAGEKERCVAAGMDDYLAKPLDPEQMNRTIERLLRPDRKPARSLIGREPVNYPELVERCMKDESLASQLLDEFITQAHETVIELQQLLADDNREGLHRVAHRINGTAATMACEHVRRIAFLLESLAHDPALPQRGPALLEELAGHVRDVADWRDIRKEKELL